MRQPLALLVLAACGSKPAPAPAPIGNVATPVDAAAVDSLKVYEFGPAAVGDVMVRLHPDDDDGEALRTEIETKYLAALRKACFEGQKTDESKEWIIVAVTLKPDGSVGDAKAVMNIDSVNACTAKVASGWKLTPRATELKFSFDIRLSN